MSIEFRTSKIEHFRSPVHKEGSSGITPPKRLFCRGERKFEIIFGSFIGFVIFTGSVKDTIMDFFAVFPNLFKMA